MYGGRAGPISISSRDRRGYFGGAEMAERFLAAAREASIKPALNFLRALVVAGLVVLSSATAAGTAKILMKPPARAEHQPRQHRAKPYW